MYTCEECNTIVDSDEIIEGKCEDCRNSAAALALLPKNIGWMEQAEQLGLELYERQPGEADQEWHVWCYYRDMYPSDKPNLRKASEALDITYDKVRKISARWGFATRMQAWTAHVDSILVNRRRTEIIEMNDQHMSMARNLNAKIARAIELIQPQEIGVKDINALMKTASELERKARVDQYDLLQAGNPNNVQEDTNPDLKKAAVKSTDIGEIIKILHSAGALENIGIRQTVTTEVVKK